MATSEIETTPVGETADPARFIVVSRHEVLAKLVDALVHGASFLALTGLPGVGKTTMAAAVRELLAARSVAAMHIGRGESGAIRLRTLAAQLLGKPEDAINGHDGEWLFDIMTARGSSDRRLVIIVDDAQLVHTEVFTYLRLLMSIGIAPIPQFLFVGDPSFWHRAGEAAHANVRDLITDWVELEPLTSTESRELVELLRGSAGPAAGAALNEAAPDESVRASDGLIGRLTSLPASAAMPPGEVRRARTADPRMDGASAVAPGESDNVSQSKHHAGWLPEDAVPVEDRLDPEVAAALFGTPSLGHESAKPRRVLVFASLAGVLTFAGLVGAVAYRQMLDPSDHGARAETAMFVEASNDGVHSAPPDTQSEPGFEIVHSAQAASGGPGAEMVPTAATATSKAVTPPAQRDRTVPVASMTASLPGVGVPREARLSVFPMVVSDDAAVTKVASGVEEPQAGSTPLSPSSIPAFRAATEAPAAPPAGPSASAAMTVDAASVPAVAQSEGPSPTASTVLPSQAGAEDADAPTVPAVAQPAAASSSAETEAPAFVAPSPAAAPSALTDAVNAGASEAGPPAGTQSAPPSSAGDNAVPLPVVSLPVAATGAVGADARTGSATVQPTAPSSAAQSEPLPSDAPPPAAASEVMKSDAIGSDTGPTAAAMQPSAPVPAPAAAAPPVSSTPAVAPEVPASGAPIPAAIVQPAAAPPATQSQAATNAAPTVATLSKAPSATAASSRFVSPDLESLLLRGDAMLDLGDISAARLLYERAAALGSAKAATTLGKTYDPAFLASVQVRGLAPNRAVAASWYRKGADLGDAEAADRLAGLAKAQ